MTPNILTANFSQRFANEEAVEDWFYVYKFIYNNWEYHNAYRTYNEANSEKRYLKTELGIRSTITMDGPSLMLEDSQLN